MNVTYGVVMIQHDVTGLCLAVGDCRPPCSVEFVICDSDVSSQRWTYHEQQFNSRIILVVHIFYSMGDLLLK